MDAKSRSFVGFLHPPNPKIAGRGSSVEFISGMSDKGIAHIDIMGYNDDVE